jgi:hypothetical protein
VFQIVQVPGAGSVDELIDTTQVTPWDIAWALLVLALSFVLGKLASRWVRRFLGNFDTPSACSDSIPVQRSC